MIDISRALTIEGWMGETELQWLAEQASRATVIVEVGAWMGRSTAALAANTRGRVYSVDTWKGSEEHESFLREKSKNWLKIQFMDNTSEFKNVTMAEMTSGAAATLFDGLGVFADLIFLDASHDYGNVAADIIDWKRLLKLDGILCGHDYYGDFPGVQQAVKELIPNHEVIPGTSIWRML